MGIDRPDEPDEPQDEHSGRSADRSSDQVETRSREEYYNDLQAAVAKETPRTSAPEASANGKPWHEVTGWSRRVWAEYQRKWPPDEHPPVDRSADPPGSWRGDGNQFLDREANEKVGEKCGRIADSERHRISPALREIESQAPDRHLVGFEHRLKNPNRIKEKVAEAIEQYNRSPEEAVSDVPDPVRYTFEYEEGRYTRAVWNDIARLEEQGFQQLKRKNSWSDEQYKGINSQWLDPGSGQRFEVQFHTRISFEAKQITHPAYERLRSGQADELEEMVLEAFQRKVSAEIPIPPGAEDIPDYP